MILKIDDADTSKLTWIEFMEKIKKHDWNQNSKKLLMRHKLTAATKDKANYKGSTVPQVAFGTHGPRFVFAGADLGPRLKENLQKICDACKQMSTTRLKEMKQFEKDLKVKRIIGLELLSCL
jgi:hypothetical protein